MGDFPERLGISKREPMRTTSRVILTLPRPYARGHAVPIASAYDIANVSFVISAPDLGKVDMANAWPQQQHRGISSSNNKRAREALEFKDRWDGVVRLSDGMVKRDGIQNLLPSHYHQINHPIELPVCYHPIFIKNLPSHRTPRRARRRVEVYPPLLQN